MTTEAEIKDEKPMTREQYDKLRREHIEYGTDPLCLYEPEIIATLDALFAFHKAVTETSTMAEMLSKELGLE